MRSSICEANTNLRGEYQDALQDRLLGKFRLSANYTIWGQGLNSKANFASSKG